jgi:hypothetical protein
MSTYRGDVATSRPDSAAPRKTAWRRRHVLLALFGLIVGMSSTNIVARAESELSTADATAPRRGGASIAPGGTTPGDTSIESIGIGRAPAPVVVAPPQTVRSVPPPAPTASPVIRGAPIQRCIVMLHGKGANGTATYQSDGTYLIAPSGNAVSGTGRQWLYASPDEFVQASDIVANAIRSVGCTQVVVAGFSNGGALAAKLYCRGVTFGGTVVGIIINDPVTDQSIDPCNPITSNVVLTQSDELAGYIGVGGPCPTSWTCEGSLVSQAVYAARLGLPPIRHANHALVPYPPYAAPWWY